MLVVDWRASGYSVAAGGIACVEAAVCERGVGVDGQVQYVLLPRNPESGLEERVTGELRRRQVGADDLIEPLGEGEVSGGLESEEWERVGPGWDPDLLAAVNRVLSRAPRWTGGPVGAKAVADWYARLKNPVPRLIVGQAQRIADLMMGAPADLVLGLRGGASGADGSESESETASVFSDAQDSDDSISVASSVTPADYQPAEPIQFQALYTGSYASRADRFEDAVAQVYASLPRMRENARRLTRALFAWLTDHREELGPRNSDNHIAKEFFAERSQPHAAVELRERLGANLEWNLDQQWGFHDSMAALERAVDRYATVLAREMDITPIPPPSDPSHSRDSAWVNEMRARGYLVSDRRPVHSEFLFQVIRNLANAGYLPVGDDFLNQIFARMRLRSPRQSYYDTLLSAYWTDLADDAGERIGTEGSRLYDWIGERLPENHTQDPVLLADLALPHLQRYGELLRARLGDEDIQRFADDNRVVLEAATRRGLGRWHAYALLLEGFEGKADDEALNAFREHLVRQALPRLVRARQDVWWAQWVSPQTEPADVLAAGRSTPATEVRRVWGSLAEAVRRAGAGDGSGRLAVFHTDHVVYRLGPGPRQDELLLLGGSELVGQVDLVPSNPLEGVVRDLQTHSTREATARRLLRLDASESLGGAELSRLARSMIEARRWLSELTSPAMLAARVTHLENSVPDPSQYNALVNTLANLAVSAVAAGRDLNNTVQLGAFHLETLGAFAPDTVFHDESGRPSGRNWSADLPSGARVQTSELTVFWETDHGSVFWETDHGSQESAQRVSAPWDGPAFLLSTEEIGNTSVVLIIGGSRMQLPYEEFVELTSRDPLLRSEELTNRDMVTVSSLGSRGVLGLFQLRQKLVDAMGGRAQWMFSRRSVLFQPGDQQLHQIGVFAEPGEGLPEVMRRWLGPARAAGRTGGARTRRSRSTGHASTRYIFTADTSDAMTEGLRQTLTDITDPSHSRILQEALESWSADTQGSSQPTARFVTDAPASLTSGPPTTGTSARIGTGDLALANKVTGSDGVVWTYPSASDGKFCVNIAVVWLE